jgi:hypothetical protein
VSCAVIQSRLLTTCGDFDALLFRSPHFYNLGMARTRSRLALLAVAGSAALFASCGGGSDTTEATIPADADVVINSVSGIQWEKKEYAVTSDGTPVKIATQNLSNEPHNLHLRGSDGVELSKALDTPNKNDIASGEFDLQLGQYTVFCTVVGHGNMKATLTVE